MMKAVREGEEFFFFFFWLYVFSLDFFVTSTKGGLNDSLPLVSFINNYPFTTNAVFVRRQAWMSAQGERNFSPILQTHLVSRVHVCFSSLPLLQPGRQSTDYNVLMMS